jgi:hypothetical protein
MSSCPFLKVEIWLFFARKKKHCPEVKAPPGEMGGCVVECNGMIILQLTFIPSKLIPSELHTLQIIDIIQR